jgi:DNA polymerase III sliding clamp (beta) subunit (PCNA family)
VIPPAEYQQHAFSTDRAGLLAAISRAIRCSKEENSPSLLIFDFSPDWLKISSNTPGVGSAAESVPGEWTGEDLQIGVNGSYLSRCLESFEGTKITFSGDSADSAWSIRGGSLEEDRVAAISLVRLRSAFQEWVDNGEG